MDAKEKELLQTVPMASFESQASRHNRVVIWLIVAWMVSVIVLGFALICSMSVSQETTDEFTTTTTEVDQAADNAGSNYFANGDMTHGSTPTGEGNTNQENNGN